LLKIAHKSDFGNDKSSASPAQVMIERKTEGAKIFEFFFNANYCLPSKPEI